MSADQQANGAFGIMIVDGEAFDAGVASIPTPMAEAGDERWFVHRYWAVDCRFDTSPQAQVMRVDIDSKAMRKVTSSDVLVAVLENNAAVDAVAFWWQFRVLFKLH